MNAESDTGLRTGNKIKDLIAGAVFWYFFFRLWLVRAPRKPDATNARIVYGCPPPFIRAREWLLENPKELRRAADEWESIGYPEYATFLRARADGKSSEYVRRPW